MQRTIVAVLIVLAMTVIGVTAFRIHKRNKAKEEAALAASRQAAEEAAALEASRQAAEEEAASIPQGGGGRGGLGGLP